MIEIEPTGKIYTKMCAVMKDIGAIGKNEKNVMQKFNFRGVDTVYNQLHSILSKHEVFTVSDILSDRHEERKSKNGGNLIYRVITIKYRFYTVDGSCVESTVIGEGMDSGDKACNKAMSVAHKYCLLQAFCIPTEEQKDPDAETHQTVPKVDRAGVIKEVKALYSDSWNEEQKAWYTTLDTQTDTQLCNALTDLKG